MKRILPFVFFLLPYMASAQYGKQILTAWQQGSVFTFNTLTTSGTSITSAIETSGDGAGAVSNQAAAFLTTTDTFAVMWDSYILNSGTAPNLRYTTGGSGRGTIQGLNTFWSAGPGKVHFKPASTAGQLETGISSAGAPVTNFSVTNVRWSKKLDSLYVSTTGNNSNQGDVSAPIATFAEAQSRGFYNGGVFNIAAGIYDETFTVAANITLYSAGNVTITAIDFADKTCTVNGCFIIGTAQNAGNVTYLNPCPSAPANVNIYANQFSGFPEFPDFINDEAIQ